MLPTIRTVLYATDLSPRSLDGFRFAMGLAHRYDAKIVLVHAVEPLSPYARNMVEMYLPEMKEKGIPASAKERILSDIRRSLEHFCQDEVCIDLGGYDRVAETCVVEGPPAETILQEARRVGADLVVVGAHSHTRVGEMLLGSVSQKVVQRCPVPVLVVRHPE